MEERMAELISALTPDEKMTLLTGINIWQTLPVKRLDIPSVVVSDGPHGLRQVRLDDEGKELDTLPALCFPTSCAMSATWNRELVSKGARALGEITGAAGVDILLGPGVNIKRTPLCGRNFEYYSEDPFLAGELGKEYIKGVQSAHVGTSLKHFAANSQEFDRFQISSEIDERTLREIYLPAFEKAVKEADPWTVMCAYNRLNGVYCSENGYLLRTILREEWGFDGIVISDWWAVHERSLALKASLELAMPYTDDYLPQLKESLEKGSLTEEELDDAVARLLTFILKAADSRSRRAVSTDEAAHREIILASSREAMTLLKNEDSLLPLKPGRKQKILVVGTNAEKPRIQGGGSSEVNYGKIESSLEVLKDIIEPEGEIEYIPGYVYERGMIQIDKLNLVMAAARQADSVIIFAGDNVSSETEARDRESIRLPLSMERLIEQTAGINSHTAVVLQSGSAVDMSSWIGGVKSVLFAWYAGEGSGRAAAEVLTGLVNPSGKTAETFPLRLEDTPAYSSYPGNGFTAPYDEGLFVGYRHYDSKNKDVLFPFGHGLSYTEFTYSALKVKPNTGDSPFPVEVSCRIRNGGSQPGKEIVQLYVRDWESRVSRPFQELKGFEKIFLKKGEEKEVTFMLNERAFSYYSTVFRDWHWETGEFEIRLGSSSRDIRLTESVFLTNKKDLS